MVINYSEFSKAIKKIDTMQNSNPKYVPDATEIERLASFVSTVRTADNSDIYNKKTGRISEYENKQVFIIPSDIGKPVVDEKDFFIYLMFISVTSDIDPKDPVSVERKKSLNKYLRANLVVK